MAIFQFVLALLLAGAGLALLAPRIGAPWPALLALAGAGLAFVPGAPTLKLDPNLALALFVAPVLLDAAFDSSPRDLRDNWAPVGSLVLVVVGLTVVAVAVTARALRPELPWAAAIALGAIVAPPDAAAATAVLQQVRLPHRLMVVLQGESLLNDASALLIYRLAIASVAGGITWWTGAGAVLGAAGGVALGWVLARVYVGFAARVVDVPAAVVLQFLGTFGVWLLADALHLSAILAVVAYGVGLARRAPRLTGARMRRASYAVWEVVVFVLNVLAFILIGLQLRGIMARLDGRAIVYADFVGAILGVTIGTRLIWVIGWGAVVRWKNRRFGAHTRRPMPLPSLGGGLVVGWCGMRGIVTLAAALALPDDFPQRDPLVLAAFGVVLGTLVLQGLTLRPLLALVRLPDDDQPEREAALARMRTAEAALAAMGDDRESEAARLLAREYESRIGACARPGQDVTGIITLRQRMLAAERTRLMALREADEIGEAAFHTVEEELDWAEAEIEVRLRGG